jgi:hypothetical protein
MKSFHLMGALLALGLTSYASAEDDELLNFDEAMEETNFAVLAKKYPRGVAENRPWAGYWWDYKGEGISRLTGDTESAAQKYDRLMGQTGNRSAQKWELENHGSKLPGVEDWWGHCNGWAAAALLEREPRRSVTVDGIRFTRADLKALLSETHMEVSTDFLGNRFDEGSMRDSDYEDVSPAQFHLAMVNLLGRQRQGMAVDRHTHDEVWNHPVIAYRMEPVTPEDYIGETRSAPGIYRVKVRMTFWMVDDSVAVDFLTPRFKHIEGEERPVFFSRTLDYELWLDAPVEFTRSGRIKSSGDIVLEEDPETGDMVGGKWLNGKLKRGDRHPDFMWIPFEPVKATDYGNPHIDHVVVSKIVRGISPHDSTRQEDWFETEVQPDTAE